MEQKDAFSSIKCLIEGHKGSQIIAICTNHKCKDSKLLCTRCTLHQHKTCSDYVILLEDVFNDDFTLIIEHPCFKNIQEIFNSYSTPSPQIFKDFDEFLDKEFAFMRTSFENLLSISREKLRQAFEKAVDDLQSDKDFKNMSVGKLTDLDQLKKFLKEIGSDGQYNTDEKTERINQFFDQYWQQYSLRASNVKGISNPQIQLLLTDIQGKSEDIRKSYQKFEESLLNGVLNSEKLISFKSKEWKFDPTAKHADIQIQNDGFVLIKKNSISHAPVYGNFALTDGIYKWEVTVSGITSPNGDWVQFGIIDKAKVPIEKFSFESGFSLTSAGYYSNHFVGMVGLFGNTQNFNNQTFLCEFNADTGVLTISGKAIKAEAKNLKGKTMYPFVNLYHPGNSVRVKPL